MEWRTLLCPSCFRFLQIAVFSKKSYEGRLSSEYCCCSHNNSARELVIGCRAHFFTSIPYTSDQLSSTCRVTLHGGFNRQAACITQNNFRSFIFALFQFSLRFIVDKLFICHSVNNYFIHLIIFEICAIH